MTKWNKDTFVSKLKSVCDTNISNIIVDLINFSETDADSINWGRGEGYGTMTYKNGDKYVGNFKDGQHNGQGTMTHADGKIEKGIWKDGIFVK